MKTSLVRLTAVIVAAMCAVSAASVRADDKADIRAVYAKLTKAMKNKDTKAIMALGTSDFTNKSPGMPEMDAKQSIEMMDQQFKMVDKITKCKMEPVKITVKGKTATVDSKYSFEAKGPGPDGKSAVSADHGTGRDTLVKTSKGWLFKRAVTLTMNPTMNGKPMKMDMPPPSAKPKK